jgi:ferric-dicitrate binding protein FerR (iron transport regulator)
LGVTTHKKVEKEKIYKKLLSGWEAPFTKTEAEAWNELEPKLALSGVPRGKLIRFNRRVWSAAAAAVVLILATTWMWPGSERVSAVCNPGERSTVDLPDGSIAYLNAASQVAFENEWTEERVIQLTGEAFFEVQKGERFSVITPGGEVEVLGTSFNVFSRENIFEVECNTGKVRVKNGNNRVEILPGEKLSWSGTEFLKTTFEPGQPDWREGFFEYVDEPWINVLREMERQYNVTFEVADVANKFYTGNFMNNNLEEALGKVCIPMNYSWEMKSNMVIVLTKR